MHAVDQFGYPSDPELRQLEFHLGELAARWRDAWGEPERQAALVAEYHATFDQLVQRGWQAALDEDSELPRALMPETYREWATQVAHPQVAQP